MNLWLEICDWVGTLCLAYVFFKLIKLGLPIIVREIFRR